MPSLSLTSQQAPLNQGAPFSLATGEGDGTAPTAPLSGPSQKITGKMALSEAEKGLRSLLIFWLCESNMPGRKPETLVSLCKYDVLTNPNPLM